MFFLIYISVSENSSHAPKIVGHGLRMREAHPLNGRPRPLLASVNGVLMHDPLNGQPRHLLTSGLSVVSDRGSRQ